LVLEIKRRKTNQNSHPGINLVSPYGAVIPDLIRDPHAIGAFAKKYKKE